MKPTLITEEHVGQPVLVREGKQVLEATLYASLSSQLMVEWLQGGMSYYFRKNNQVTLKE